MSPATVGDIALAECSFSEGEAGNPAINARRIIFMVLFGDAFA